MDIRLIFSSFWLDAPGIFSKLSVALYHLGTRFVISARGSLYMREPRTLNWLLNPPKESGITPAGLPENVLIFSVVRLVEEVGPALG